MTQSADDQPQASLKGRSVSCYKLRTGIFLLSSIALLWLSIGQSQAANYIFPGNLPSGCSGSNGNYTCGSLELSYGDTIAIAAPKPATITINGRFATNNGKINIAGAVSDLTLVVTGRLTAEYQTNIQANVTAGSVSDSSGNATFGGSLAVTTGNIVLSYQSSVASTVSSTTGNITIGQNNVIGGSVSSTSGAIQVGYASRINGDINTRGNVTIEQSSVVTGKVVGFSGNVSVGYAASVSGSITTNSGNITLAQSSVVSSCVTSTASSAITLDYQANVNSVCCGSNCGSACVTNNSTYSMPTLCTATASTSVNYYPVPIPFDSLNEDITGWSNGSVYAGKFSGSQTLGGVPFTLQTDTSGHNTFWGSNLTPWTLRSSSSGTLTLTTNLVGTSRVYALINSAWGSYGSNVGSITFNASNGDSYSVDLVEGVNVRDHFYGSFVNNLSDSSVTKNVMGSNTSGTARLDMQAFDLPSSFLHETLTSIVFISRGSSATGLPFLAGITAKASSLGSTADIPSSFNCVEVGAAATGRLYTKLANTAFNLDILALKSDGSIDTAYVGDTNKQIILELVNGAGDTACDKRAVLSADYTQLLSFTSGNSGRKTAAIGATQYAYSDVRCRITDANQATAVVACSSDDFAIRPSSLSLSSAANADTTGTSASATPVVKAGSGFELTASSDVLGYNGTPMLNSSVLVSHSGAVVSGSVSGSFNAAAASTGMATNNNFSYSEVGYFALAAGGVYDANFTAVDSANSDCSDDFSNVVVGGKLGCKFGNTTQTDYFGRFTPDHFDVVLNNPVFEPACGHFSYIGQPIRFASNPVATVTAKNTGGNATQNYTSHFWKINPSDSHYAITPSYTEASQSLTVLNNAAPLVVDQGNGSGTLSFADTSSNILGVTRGDPLAAFKAEIAMSFNVWDSDGVLVANVDGVASTHPQFGAAISNKGISFSGGYKTQRWGRLVLGNAYGSELKDLTVPLFTEYYNGTSFIHNAEDNCTTLALNNHLTLSNPGTASGAAQLGNATMTLGTGLTKASLTNGTLVSGWAGLSFSTPGAGNTGYVDINGNFTDLPWLLFDWDHNGTQDNSPAGKVTFGLYKGSNQQIYQRELY